MQVLEISEAPALQIPFLNAAGGGKTRHEVLPFHLGRVDLLPDGVDALLVASDLQGIHIDGTGRHLLGVGLAGVLRNSHAKFGLAETSRVGVVLAGDLFAAESGSVRGATGDVLAVWSAFRQDYAWIVGVCGNHDTFSRAFEKKLTQDERMHLLDGDVAVIGGVTIGGVGYIIGKAGKQGRVSEDDFIDKLEMVLANDPALLVLHEGPPGTANQPGNQRILDVVRRAEFRSLLVCGHSHWDEPLFELAGMQILNVDKRALLLTK